MRLLIVEDEQTLLSVIEKRMVQEGYSVDTCGDGDDALAYLAVGEYDCVVLDIMLPGVDGLAVLRDMRAKRNATPVLLLTARDTVADRVAGLDAGADDYLVKPFSFDELSARVRAMLRRAGEEKHTVLTLSDLAMDTVTQNVTRGGARIELTAKEYALLEYFMRHPGHILTRSKITEHVWNLDFDCDSNIVDVYVRYLRRKMDKDFPRKLLHTVRGSGYVLREEL